MGEGRGEKKAGFLKSMIVTDFKIKNRVFYSIRFGRPLERVNF